MQTHPSPSAPVCTQPAPGTPQANATKAINALRKRLERWELEHLRALSASLSDQLEAANERVEALHSDLARAWRNAEAWQDDAMELVKALEAAGTEVGITQAGQLVAIDAQGGAA